MIITYLIVFNQSSSSLVFESLFGMIFIFFYEFCDVFIDRKQVSKAEILVPEIEKCHVDLNLEKTVTGMAFVEYLFLELVTTEALLHMYTQIAHITDNVSLEHEFSINQTLIIKKNNHHNPRFFNGSFL